MSISLSVQNLGGSGGHTAAWVYVDGRGLGIQMLLVLNALLKNRIVLGVRLWPGVRGVEECLGVSGDTLIFVGVVVNPKQINAINSQVNEQANSGLQKVQGQLAYMNNENFKIHCSLFLALKNMDKKLGLSVHDLHL